MKIYIVEDEVSIATALSNELATWGYDTLIAKDFNNIMQDFNDYKPNLVVMDISLPYYNGYYWTQKIRENSNIPIIFISSFSEDSSVIQAMQFGADEFITKPINLSVASAKIRAIIRRTYDYALDSDKLMYNNASLDISNSTLQINALSIDLTRTELMILLKLFLAKGQIVKRESILDYCWQGENFIDDNTLAVNIARIRKKLSDLGLEDIIVTKRGVGYALK